MNPVSRRPYMLNRSLSGKKLGQLMNNGAAVAAVYEGEEASDGTRGVLFANGAIERVSRQRWRQLSKQLNRSR